jgi:AICAR transformylase/IMP cyclohydrolase PurH
MDQGIEIYMTQLDTVTVAGDGQTATIGGGAMSKAVVDSLWNAGKQAGRCLSRLSRISTMTGADFGGQ